MLSKKIIDIDTYKQNYLENKTDLDTQLKLTLSIHFKTKTNKQTKNIGEI